MNVAISQRIILNNNGGQADSLEQNYIKYFQAFGITLIPIPNNLNDILFYLKSLNTERIILSGGGDIDPRLYGGKTNQQGNYSPQRAHTESQMVKFAKKNDIPVLGICRGAQFLNIFFDGSLIQDLKKKLQNTQNHVATDHQIKLVDQETIKYFLDNGIFVNSYHNSGMRAKELSLKLKTFAISQDDLIEGFYHPQLPIAAIMWHPERKSPDLSFNHKLIEAFIKRKLYWSKK